MTFEEFEAMFPQDLRKTNQVQSFHLSEEALINIYPKSICQKNHALFFIAQVGYEKFLFVVEQNRTDILDPFEGEVLLTPVFQEEYKLKRCPLVHSNAKLVRELFEFTRPGLIGVSNSFGFGDRLGLANPAHLRAVAGTGFRVVLAQQSIRELQRTRRTPQEVLDAATWAVFQEGYHDGFGADADHLKTTEDIDRMVRAGFTMFTIDPGEFVVNEADHLSIKELQARAQDLPWEILQNSPENFIARYDGQTFHIDDDFTLQPSKHEILKALIKYGGVLAHTVKLYRYFQQKYSGRPAEFELSVDETESVTSPFEHFLVVNELKRLGVELVSLAPRFVGDFEKGIDYKGDLKQFKQQYLQHVKIAEKLGPYKISVHSGSDKFQIYETIGSLQQGSVHVKTAGTSYLEALRTVAATNPSLFREILDFARTQYDSEKATYHVSASVDNVPEAQKCSDVDLMKLFEQNDARQVLHVTFGKVLTEKDQNNTYRFRDRILQCLKENEDTHYAFVEKHFRRHFKPFLKN